MRRIPTVHNGEETYISDERRPGDVPLVGQEQEDICARRAHLVTLTRVNGLLLDSLDLQRLELLVEHLALRTIDC